MAAAGCLSLAREAVRAALARSAAFRTWTATADQTAALAKIHPHGLPDPAASADKYSLVELRTYRPYALIYTDVSGGYASRKDAQGFAKSGRIIIELEQDATVGEGQSRADVDQAWENTVGAIIDNLEANDGADVVASGVDLILGPLRNEPENWPEYGEVNYAALAVNYAEGVQ